MWTYWTIHEKTGEWRISTKGTLEECLEDLLYDKSHGKPDKTLRLEYNTEGIG